MQNFKNKFLNQKGFSLIEIMAATAILSVVGVMAARGLGIAYDSLKVSDVKEAQTNLSANVLNSMATNASVYQVDYSDRNPLDIFPDKESYTRAWDTNGRDDTVARCPKCRGRYDYIIKHSTISSELNILYLYVYHPDFPGNKDKDKYKLYKRVVGNR